MALPVWSLSEIITQLDSGAHIGGLSWTIGFPLTNAWIPTGQPEKAGFSPLTAGQQSAALLAMQVWDDLIPASTTFNGSSAASTIKVSNEPGMSDYAYGYYPSPGWAGSSVWLNTSYAELKAPVAGDYAFMTLLHELGHTLGLNHMGNYNGSANWATDASSVQDSHLFTVMSYFSVQETGQANWTVGGIAYSPQTPMISDILAIQSMYGADTTTRAGNTTYGFHASGIAASEAPIYDFTVNDHPILTIYDAGGYDTLDLSGFNSNSWINILPGKFSNADGMTRNIGIAHNTNIEMAIGGNGNDSMIGSHGNNTLIGGAGNDLIYGALGNDTLTGGTGADTFVFGVQPTGSVRDIVTDFTVAGVNHDTIQVAKGLAVSFASLVGSGAIAQVGANTVITLAPNESVTLLAVQANQLNASDFYFV